MSLSAMRRTRFAAADCPAARALDSVGDWWSILILREAFRGLTRFDQFTESLGVAPNILSARLRHLVAEGMFETRAYGERPVRREYVLTEKGRDFFPVLTALFAWGNRRLPPETQVFRLGDPVSGGARDPVVVDRATGEVLTPANTVLMPGPAVTPQASAIIDAAAARRAAASPL